MIHTIVQLIFPALALRRPPSPESWQPQPRVRGAYFPPASWERPIVQEEGIVRPYAAALGVQGEPW